MVLYHLFIFHCHYIEMCSVVEKKPLKCNVFCHILVTWSVYNAWEGGGKKNSTYRPTFERRKVGKTTLFFFVLSEGFTLALGLMSCPIPVSFFNLNSSLFIVISL